MRTFINRWCGNHRTGFHWKALKNINPEYIMKPKSELWVQQHLAVRSKGKELSELVSRNSQEGGGRSWTGVTVEAKAKPPSCNTSRREVKHRRQNNLPLSIATWKLLVTPRSLVLVMCCWFSSKVDCGHSVR